MRPDAIQHALGQLANETDPNLKNLRAAALCLAAFRSHGVELIVVGGSAIEFYTDGAYVSGDVDLCQFSGPRLGPRERQTIMGTLGASGGPRNWRLAGVFVDLLGDLESLARTPPRFLESPVGIIRLAPVEELLVERVLAGTYPSSYPPAIACARKLIAAGLQGEVDFDWNEVHRLAELSAYSNRNEVDQLIDEQTQAFEDGRPHDPNR